LCMRACVCVFACVCMCAHACVYSRVFVHKYTRTHAHTRTRVCVHVTMSACMHVCKCVCVHVCMYMCVRMCYISLIPIKVAFTPAWCAMKSHLFLCSISSTPGSLGPSVKACAMRSILLPGQWPCIFCTCA